MNDIPQRLASALADRYLLEREVGAGGMATVYLARDLRHKRSVAVKVIRPELAGAGLAIGTPNSMSPEQATGDTIDARSDQYSLGCVLYEMLAGEAPFTGPSPQSVVAKSLSASSTPPEPSAVRRVS